MSDLVLPPGARPSNGKPKRPTDGLVGFGMIVAQAPTGEIDIDVHGGVRSRLLIAAILEAGMIARGGIADYPAIRAAAISEADSLALAEKATPPVAASPSRSPR